MEIIAVGNVVCDSSQLGNGGVFFAETELGVGGSCCWLTKDVSRTAIICSNNFASVLRRLIGL